MSGSIRGGDVRWCRFKFNDAVAEKGEDGARWHFGLIAQRVAKVLVNHGLDPYSAGLVYYDEWDEQREEIIEERITPAVTQPIVARIRIPDQGGGEDSYIEEDTGEVRIIQEERVEEIHTGEYHITREAGSLWGIRYEEAYAIDAAFKGRQAARTEARLAIVEARLLQIEALLAA